MLKAAMISAEAFDNVIFTNSEETRQTITASKKGQVRASHLERMLSGENLSVYTYFLQPGAVPLDLSRFCITAGVGTTTFVPQRVHHSIVHLFVELDFFPKASGCRGSGGAPYLFELGILFSSCFVSTSSVVSHVCNTC